MPVYDARQPRAKELHPALTPVDVLPVPDGGARVYDATGVRILYVVRCDTDTGELERYDVTTGADGRGVFKVGPDGRVAVVREVRPAPLRLVPILPGESYHTP